MNGICRLRDCQGYIRIFSSGWRLFWSVSDLNKSQTDIYITQLFYSYLWDLILLKRRDAPLLKRPSLGARSSFACEFVITNQLLNFMFLFTCSQIGTSPTTGFPCEQSRPIGERQQQQQQHLRSLSPPTSLHMCVHL